MHRNWVGSIPLLLSERNCPISIAFDIRSATPADTPALVTLRDEAMRPSLTAIGRYDPETSKRRFLDGYVEADTEVIQVDGRIAGFFVIRKRPDHLYLDHLYVSADYQGQGIGSTILNQVKAEADSHAHCVRLRALMNSPANAFYRANGFTVLAVEEFDTLYEWRP